jgi:hypothetical protein
MDQLDTEQLEQLLTSMVEKLQEIKDEEEYLEVLIGITAIVTHLYRNIEVGL